MKYVYAVEEDMDRGRALIIVLRPSLEIPAFSLTRSMVGAGPQSKTGKGTGTAKDCIGSIGGASRNGG